ncbi:MAG: hypothetical protein OS112_10990 [Methanoregula sp.]|nr:MAG: hypothetical protein OS112_10990 [Methanoregula sp.]
MPGKVSVKESHDFSDHPKSEIKIEFPRLNITIHIEPCNGGCTRCGLFCMFFDKQKLQE